MSCAGHGRSASWRESTFTCTRLFCCLVGFIVVATWVESHDVARTLFGVLFVLVIFGCIVLHELGHALTARRYGIRTRDIVLLPIGGVARLERMPEDPNQELLVAVAGPAVNVLIAVGLFAVLVALGRFPTLRQAETISWTGHNFLASLMAVNVWLGALQPDSRVSYGRRARAARAAGQAHGLYGGHADGGAYRPGDRFCFRLPRFVFRPLPSLHRACSFGWGRAARRGWYRCAAHLVAFLCSK